MSRPYHKLYERPREDIRPDTRFMYIEAPIPHCFMCKQDHIKIIFKPGSLSYRCEGCYTYGGPVMIRIGISGPMPKIPIPDILPEDKPAPVKLANPYKGKNKPRKTKHTAKETIPDVDNEGEDISDPGNAIALGEISTPKSRVRKINSRRPVEKPLRRSRKLQKV